MWVSTERSYRLIQTPFKSAKNVAILKTLLHFKPNEPNPQGKADNETISVILKTLLHFKPNEPNPQGKADNETIFACHFFDEVQLVYREELSRTICSHPQNLKLHHFTYELILIWLPWKCSE